jgi:hypothetical protein
MYSRYSDQIMKTITLAHLSLGLERVFFTHVMKAVSGNGNIQPSEVLASFIQIIVFLECDAVQFGTHTRRFAAV